MHKSSHLKVILLDSLSLSFPMFSQIVHNSYSKIVLNFHSKHSLFGCYNTRCRGESTAGEIFEFPEKNRSQ